MEHCDTLILPRWIVPVAPAGTVLEAHAVAVSEGRITAVLPAAEARARFQPSVLVERPDHVLIPGLVNAHTHAAMTLLRGFADDLSLESWLRERIWPAESRWVSPPKANAPKLGWILLLRQAAPKRPSKGTSPPRALGTHVDQFARRHDAPSI